MIDVRTNGRAADAATMGICAELPRCLPISPHRTADVFGFRDGAWPPVSACKAMDRDQHREWLAELAANDLRRRREAQPELASKETALQEARANLSRSEAAVQALEAELDADSQEADDLEDG